MPDTKETLRDVLIWGAALLEADELADLGMPGPTPAGDPMRNAVQRAGRKQQQRRRVAVAGVR